METATVFWILENRVLYVKRPSVVSIESLEQDNENIVAMLDAGEAPIHLIHDTLSVGLTPRKVRLIRKATTFLEHPDLGWFITVTSNPFISFLGNLVPQMCMSNKAMIKVVSTVDEASSFLHKVEQDMDWSNAQDNFNATQQIS